MPTVGINYYENTSFKNGWFVGQIMYSRFTIYYIKQ